VEGRTRHTPLQVCAWRAWQPAPHPKQFPALAWSWPCILSASTPQTGWGWGSRPGCLRAENPLNTPTTMQDTPKGNMLLQTGSCQSPLYLSGTNRANRSGRGVVVAEVGVTPNAVTNHNNDVKQSQPMLSHNHAVTNHNQCSQTSTDNPVNQSQPKLPTNAVNQQNPGCCWEVGVATILD